MEDNPEYKMFVASGKELYKSKLYSDAELVVGDKTWSIHKSILCTRSIWFKKALGGSFEEGRTNKLSIEGHDPMYVELVLRYMYTGEKPTSKELPRIRNLVDLLVAADYLGIEPLVSEASNMLEAYLFDKRSKIKPNKHLFSDEEMDEFFYAAHLAYMTSPSLEVMRTPIENFIDRYTKYLATDSRFMKKLNNVPGIAVAIVRCVMAYEWCPYMPEECALCKKKLENVGDMAETWSVGEPPHTCEGCQKGGGQRGGRGCSYKGSGDGLTIRGCCHACSKKQKSSQAA